MTPLLSSFNKIGNNDGPALKIQPLINIYRGQGASITVLHIYMALELKPYKYLYDFGYIFLWGEQKIFGPFPSTTDMKYSYREHCNVRSLVLLWAPFSPSSQLQDKNLIPWSNFEIFLSLHFHNSSLNPSGLCLLKNFQSRHNFWRIGTKLFILHPQ